MEQAEAAKDPESDPAPVEPRGVGAEDRFLHEARAAPRSISKQR